MSDFPTVITIAWIALPLFLGFGSYLLHRFNRWLALAVALISLTYGLWRVLVPGELVLELLDNFGVTLQVDSLSGYFILTNALVTAAVVLYCWQQGKTAFFYTQVMILHGSVNAVFICADFISLYVALEVIGIAAFLLIAYPRSDRAIWVGLRYLFVSNTAMLFYLIGAVLVYQANQSFAFTGLRTASTEAIALIFLGLLTKGGIFMSGLWLPLTHAESETAVSAMLSGAVVKTGVFPLVRCALLVEEIGPIVQVFSMATALLGVTYAIFEKDTKRMLAASTTSQLGFVLVAPAAAGFYALSHGLAKAALFLMAGNLSSRDFEQLRQRSLPLPAWIAIAVASLSISGLPFLAGFSSKALTLKELTGLSAVIMNAAAVGTAIAFAKFIFIPVQRGAAAESGGLKKGLLVAVAVLIAGLLLTTGLGEGSYSVANVAKALSTIGGGWLVYLFVIQKQKLALPRAPERLEHLIGGMSLVLLLLFGMVLA